MKSTFRALFAFSTIGLSLAAVPASASQLDPLRVSVPFAFTAGKTSLPAGDYTVLEDDSKVILIRGSRGGVLLLGTYSAEVPGEKSGISFRHTAKGYILQAVHASGRPSTVIALPEAAQK